MKLYPLTTSQKNILNIQQLYPDTSISNICGALIFNGKLDVGLLEQAVNEEIRLQDGMRLRFCKSNGETVQYVSSCRCEKYDFRKFDSPDELKRFGDEYALSPFELFDSCMYRATLFELCGKSGVLLCASHLISDAWTCSILANDILHIYNRLVGKEDAVLSERSYADYAQREQKYFNSEKYELDRAFWTEKYSKLPDPGPVKLIRTASVSPAAGRFSTVLPTELSTETDRFCKENGLSRAVVFETAVLAYLASINKENRSVTIGVPVLNRNNPSEKRTVGMCILTVPVTIEISDGESMLSLCGKTAACHRQVFRHRRYPYVDILKNLRGSKDFSGNLFSVMVSCQNAATDINASTCWFPNGFSENPLSVHFDNRDSSDSYTITLDYQKDIFQSEEEISLLAERIILIIKQLTEASDMTLEEISILPDEEYRKVVYDFNNTYADYPKDKCVHELFSVQAEKTPNKTALVFENEEFTYRRLDEMSDSIAVLLRERGIKHGSIVPVISVRSPYIIVAMLGILKAGGAYMPVSPSYPRDRIEYMLETAGAGLSLTYGCSFGLTEEIDLQGIDYSHIIKTPYNVNNSDNLCYVIFTSGSTGKPKGVSVSHRNVVNYCAENRYNVVGKIIGKDAKSIISVTNFIFDIFVTESILPLLNGITIYLANDAQCVSQELLGKLVTESGAEIIQTTPTKMRSFISDRSKLDYLSVFKTIILGGEEFPSDLYEKLRKYTSAEIYNIYGPAETTVWSSVQRVDACGISIGRPVANTHIYILDSSGRPRPVGIDGELCIAGDGVGKGYINRPELTAEKFIPSPFVKGEIIYRTGDSARMNADGSIDFLGRIDSQVKLHGLRIELCEIESVMSSFEGIRLAAVSDIHSDDGRHYLAGYFVSDGVTDIGALRAYLSSRLPAYMVPNYFMRLDEMPLTASGKTDRKGLPAPDITNHSAEYIPPETEKEKILCGILSELLGNNRVGVTDDFFEIGGDSLTMIEYSAAAQEAGIAFPIQYAFECHTVRELCGKLEHCDSVSTHTERLGDYPEPRSVGDMRLLRLFAGFTRFFYDFEVSGLEKLDVGKRYIFCPNHESDLDCMWVWTALSGFADINKTCALIAREHLDKKLPRIVFRLAGGIPIDRSGDFVPSMNRALKVLETEKRYILIHPEGTRTRTGALGKFKRGAAVISADSGISIVPVCINGAYEIFPPNKKLPRLFNFRKLGKYPLKISFGVPVDAKGKSTERITEEIRRQITEMKAWKAEPTLNSSSRKGMILK